MKESCNNFLPCSVTLHIEYINSKNQHSKRLIDVKQFSTDINSGIKAFCHSRRMVRSFNYHGLISVVDTASGEVINPENLIDYLQSVYDANPAREFDRFAESMRPLVDILVFIGYCDGKYTPPEYDHIAKWLLNISAIPDHFHSYAVDRMKRWHNPSYSDFLHAIRLFNQQHVDLKNQLITQAEKVALADKKLTENEKDSLIILKRMLGVENEA